MIWDDYGYLVGKNKYNENSLISEIYTENHGKVSGIIFGGTSKKIKNYLQIGNKIYINYNTKSENRLGYFKIEIQEALSPFFFDDRKKLSCISSAMHLVKMLTADSQTNHLIFKLIENFYTLLKNDDWIKNYIYWELELFKLLGFDIEFKDLVEKKIISGQPQYISKSSIEKKIVPNFLINKTQNNVDLKNLLIGLRLVGDYLDKTILKPNNLTHPISRSDFLNTLK